MYKAVVKIFRNITVLTASKIFNLVVHFLVSLQIINYLAQESYGYFLITLSFVSFFSILAFQDLNKPLIRRVSKSLDSAEGILNEAIIFRFFTSVGSLICCVLVSTLMPYDSNVKFFILVYSSSLILTSFVNFILLRR